MALMAKKWKGLDPKIAVIGVAIALTVGLIGAGYFSWRWGTIWVLLVWVGVLSSSLLLLCYRQLQLGGELDRAHQDAALQLDDLAAKTVRLSTIYRVADAFSDAVELPELLGQGLERAVCAPGVDGGQIHLDGGSDGQLERLAAIFSQDARFRVDGQSIVMGQCVCDRVVAEDAPIAVTELLNEPLERAYVCPAGGSPSIASVALKTRGGSLGEMTVFSCDPHHFVLQDVELLESIASFLAAVIENARIRFEMQDRIALLSADLQQLAIVEERERIRREMHDGLAQTLGLLNVQVEMVKGALRAGESQAAEVELAQLDDYVRHAYSEVREALSDLRHTEPQGESFVPTLRDYLDEFGRRNQLETDLVLDNGSGPVCLPPLVELQLHRVIHEALTNVRRHARARQVQVQISQSGTGWRVAVADDGVGFAPMAGGNDSFGLLTMRERVESLGGEFDIQSQPGLGTRVVAFVPCR